MTRFLTAALFLCAPSLRGEVEPERMIRALAAVENGQPDDLGGECHMREAAWSDRTKLPYYLSRNPAHARNVYRLHLVWLARQLTRAGVRITPQSVATCWRYGVAGAKRRGFRSEYADRVANIYHENAP